MRNSQLTDFCRPALSRLFMLNLVVTSGVVFDLRSFRLDEWRVGIVRETWWVITWLTHYLFYVGQEPIRRKAALIFLAFLIGVMAYIDFNMCVYGLSMNVQMLFFPFAAIAIKRFWESRRQHPLKTK